MEPPHPDHNERARPVRGVVAVIVRDDQFLVIRRSRHVVAPRLLCFPGGAIEDGESEEEALVREVHEELGISIEPLRALWQSITPWHVEIRWWHAQLDCTAVPVPNTAEVESFHWMTAQVLHRRDDLLESNRNFLAAITAGTVQLTG